MGHFFNGEMAYTEDRILILNVKAVVIVDYGEDIFIEDMNRKIENFFIKFGATKVRRIVQPFINIHQGTIVEYIIEFVCPRAAAVVLRKKLYKVGDWRIEVKACDSLRQPSGQIIIQEVNNYFDMNVVGSNNTAPILTLNDDCLEHICKLLSLDDVINFALSCRRFCTILALSSRIHMKNFKTSILNELTLLQVRIFLQIVGPQVISLTVTSKLHPLIVSFLGMFLINVEKLKVIGNYSTNRLSSLVKNMHSLRELEFEDVHFDGEFTKVLEELENLKSLTIVNNAFIKSSDIANLTGLEKLVLNFCRKIKPQFKDICKNLTNLYYLELRGIDLRFGTVDYEHIAKYLLHLRTLKIVCDYGNCSCLAKLPNLKVLEVDFVYTDPGKLFINLAEYQANQLEELRIGSMSDLAIDDVFSVSRLKNLKVLKCDMNMNDDIVEQFSNLNQLENIEVYEIANLTDDGLLNLLKCCRKLKRVLLWCYLDEKENLLIKLRKLLKQQIDQGERNSGVEFVFHKKGYRSIPLEHFELAGVLKVTENFNSPVRLYDYLDEEYDDNDCYGNSSDDSL